MNQSAAYPPRPPSVAGLRDIAQAAMSRRLLRRTARRRAEAGNALLEFVLTLPIVIFMTGLVITMAMAMLTKQQTLVEARYHLWRAAGHGHWSDMKLEGWVPAGSGGATADDGDMPRGTGEELSRLYDDVAPETVARTSDAQARDYFSRLWGNLPGRHKTEATRTFKTQGGLWDFIQRSATSDHFRDSSPWHFYHLDAWKIARSGPLREIFEAFRDNLQADVAPHFKPTRDDIILRWWHGNDILDEETQ